MEGYLAAIMLFGGNFAPRTWAFCQGQLLSIAQNTALFSLLGTTYGGNGQTTFQLPDLRGRVAIGQGQGPGLSNYSLGEVGGSESVTLINGQMPAHNHALNASTVAGTTNAPGNSVVIGAPTAGGRPANVFVEGATNTTLAATSIGISGGTQPHENRSPYLSINYIICLQGIFPSRN